MAFQTRGSFETRVLVDGARAFHLRFQVERRRHTVVLHERPGCGCGCGGGWREVAARAELDDLLARVRVGIWRPRPPRPRALGAAARGPMPTFGEYAASWLEAKIAGVAGDRPIAENTVSDYRSRLRHLAYLDPCPLDRIDAGLCIELKARLLAEAREVGEAIAAGEPPRERRRRRRPLGPASVRKVLDALGSILEGAVEDGLIEHNPARGRRMRVKVPKPARTCLEIDELACLLEAAADQDAPVVDASSVPAAGRSARAVAELAALGLRPKQIGERVGLSRATVAYHLRRLGIESAGGYVGRRVICELLGRGGVRVGELCELRVGDVRLHDPGGARFAVRESKTEAGERLVEMSPALAEAVARHIARLRALGLPSGPDAYLVPNRHGGRLSRGRVARIVAKAARLASERLAAKGMPPLPHTTPHTLRRTYISIALIANEFDVKFVMAQVGHANSAMTMDVYAQLEQRAKRSHGQSFDRLVEEAREQVGAAALAPSVVKCNNVSK